MSATTIANETGLRADAKVTASQVGAGVLMNLGARDLVKDDAGGLLMFRIGSARIVRKAIIVLNGLDLYDVEIGRMDRTTYEWIVEAQVRNVYGEDLGETLLRLHDEVS